MNAPSKRVNVSEGFAVEAHDHVARLGALTCWPMAGCHEVQSDVFPRKDGHASQHMLGVVDFAFTNARSSR